MNTLKFIVALIGRILISIIFLIAGIQKIFDWHAMEEGVIQTFCDWHTYVGNLPWAQAFFQTLIPWGPVLLGVALFLEIVGGLLVLLCIKVRIGALFLLLFLIPATILYHPFWFLEGQNHDFQLIMFLKNLAILGGLFTLLTFGSGRFTKKASSSFSFGGHSE